jgi:quercetin dioxygenase-like cupin family protein
VEPHPGVFVSNASTQEWEYDTEVGGQIHVLCSNVGIEAGLNRFLPGAVNDVIRYTPPSRETLLVLEGRARIQITGGPSLELMPGSMVSMPGGTETTWQITEAPFKEFWVLAG